MITTINEWKKHINEYRDGNESSLDNSLEYYKVNGWEDIYSYFANKTNEDPSYSDDWDEVKEHIDIINKGFEPRSNSIGYDLVVYRKTDNEDLTKHVGFISTTENKDLLNSENFIAFRKKYTNVIHVEPTALIIDLHDTEMSIDATDETDGLEDEFLLSPKNTYELIKQEGDTLHYRAYYK